MCESNTSFRHLYVLTRILSFDQSWRHLPHSRATRHLRLTRFCRYVSADVTCCCCSTDKVQVCGLRFTHIHLFTFFRLTSCTSSVWPPGGTFYIYGSADLIICSPFISNIQKVFPESNNSCCCVTVITPSVFDQGSLPSHYQVLKPNLVLVT